MVLRRLVTQKPMVTAGFRWPPEMWATAVTMIADGKSIGEREAEGGDGALAGGAEIFIGADGADREED